MTPFVTDLVIGIVALAVINFAYKAAGPALLVDREPSPVAVELVTALSPALLAGLVVVELTGPGWQDLDWTALPGLSVAAVIRLRGVPVLICLGVAVLLTATVRLCAL